MYSVVRLAGRAQRPVRTILTAVASVALSLAPASAQTLRATVGTAPHYLTASCGGQPAAGATPISHSGAFYLLPGLPLLKVDGAWLPGSVSSTGLPSTGIGNGQSTVTSTISADGIVTSTEVGYYYNPGFTSISGSSTLNLNTKEFTWCRDIVHPAPLPVEHQYRRATLPVTLTPFVLSADLAIATFAPPKSLKKGVSAVPAIAQVRNIGQQVTAPTILDVELQDSTTGAWRRVGSRAVPSLTPGQAEQLPANADALTVPDDMAISIYKHAEAGEEGTNVLRACIRPVSGETQTTNNCATMPTRAVTINSACHVAALDPIPAGEADALELERLRQQREPPARFLAPPLLDHDLARRIDAFISRAESLFCPSGACRLFKASGFRPIAYTRHLYGGSQALRRIGSPPILACVDYRAALLKHFNGEHGILLNGKHAGLQLNRPGTTNHERHLAIDVGGLAALPGASPRSRGPIDDIARDVGLHRPCWNPKRPDYVHFELRATNCRVFSVTAGRNAGSTPDHPGRSADTTMPIHILVTDPRGRRVGFDPSIGAVVNEIGDDAFYVVTDGEAEIVVDSAEEGAYTVSGVGADGGAYTLAIDVEETEGDVLSSEVTRGEAVAGAPIDTKVVTVVEQPSLPPGLEVGLNSGGFAAGETLILTGTLTPFAAPMSVDAYIVAQLPDGQFQSLQLNGALVPGIVPIARSFVPFDFEGPLAQYTFTGAEPKGTYTWYSVLTEPGTLNFVTPLRELPFTVR